MAPVRWSAAALMAMAIPAVGVFAVPVSSGGLPGLTAHAESKLKDAQSKVHALVDRLRHGEMPAGISKSNGRIEATQIDVAAKYPGRLEQVTVEEGDEVTAGQMIARISSPEYEAELRGAQAQVLKAKQALAEAEALISQRKSDQVFTQSDLERGRQLVDKGYLTRQVYDQRVARAEAAEAGLHAAEAQHEAAQFAIKAAESEVERINAILADLRLVAPRTGRVQYLIHRAGEVVNAGTRVVTNRCVQGCCCHFSEFRRIACPSQPARAIRLLSGGCVLPTMRQREFLPNRTTN